MQAVIMAGGKGKRLHRVTEDLIPKPLVQIHDKTLLDLVILHAIKNGCKNIIICTGHLGNKIQEHIAKTNFDIPIRISQEHEARGTAGALFLVKDQLENEFFVLYGDVYTTINLQKMYAFHKQKKADVTLAVHKSDHPQDSTVVRYDEDSRIKEFIEKPGVAWEKYSQITTTPLYIIKKDMVKFIPQGNQSDLAKDVFPMLVKKKKQLFGYLTDEYAKDMGTAERYNKVLQLLKE